MRIDHSESKASQATPSVPVAIYARVSTDKQVGGRFDSCEHQAETCRKFIDKQAHRGWREIACYTDLAYSGGSMERPGIRALRTDINAGLIKVVIIYKLERVLRSTYEWSRFSQFLEDHNCRLVSPSEDLSDGSASGRLKTNILMSFAEYERLNVAEKTKAKMQALARRGMWGGGVVPYGYDYDYQQQLLHPHTTEASIVKKIYDRAAKLMPLVRITAELNREGCHTRVRWIRRKDQTRQRIGGHQFRSDALARLIANPIYRGIIRYDGQEYAGRHSPLISKEKWELANASIGQSRDLYRTRTIGRDNTGNLLKGVLKCEDCGGVMLSKASGKTSNAKARYRYYSCKRKRSCSAKQCHSGDIAAESMDKAVVGFWQLLGSHAKALDSVISSVRDTTDLQRDLDARLARLAAKIGKLNSQMDNCVDVLAEEGASGLTTDLVRRIDSLEQKRRSLLVDQERQRQRLQTLDGITPSREDIRLAITVLSKRLGLLEAEEKRVLFQRIFDSISVDRLLDKTEVGSSKFYRMTFKLRLADLVYAMQLKGVDINMEVGRKVLGSGRIECIECEFLIGPKGRVAVCHPFAVEFGTSPPSDADVEKRSKPQNPILRAQRWAEQLQKVPYLSIRDLAKCEKVSPALVSQHLKLLKLRPEIVSFVRNLDEESAVRVFGYRALIRLTNLVAWSRADCLIKCVNAWVPKLYSSMLPSDRF